MQLDGRHSATKMPVISTGSISLDRALGIGGLPMGRIVEIYGPASTGKSTLALHIIAEAQKEGGVAALIDSEHAFDKSYAERLGVDASKMLIAQPDHGEQALDIANQLIRSESVKLVVLDSVAALVPRSEIEGDMGNVQPGSQARLMSQALRKLTGTIHKTNAICLFINQIREKIGIKFGNPETTSGGNALKFYASVRIDLRRIAGIQKEGVPYGHQVRAKIVKNKVAPPFRIATFDIIYGQGIAHLHELLDLAVTAGKVVKSGSWYAYNEEKMGQGREVAVAWLHAHPKVIDHLSKELKGAL